MNGLQVIDAHVTLGPGQYIDCRPEAVLRLMDQYGIEKALVSPSDQWLATDNRAGNRQMAKYVKHWKDRFMGYASVNPWSRNRAIDELERALGDGLSAIYINPLRQGFILLEKIIEPVFEIADRSMLTVYVVTGISVLSMPLQLSEVARRYPNASFIMGRSGWSDFHLMDFLPAVQQAANLYVETANNFPETIGAAIRAVGIDRILFSSDAPFSNLRLEIEKILQMDLSRQQFQKIFAGNIIQLLNRQC